MPVRVNYSPLPAEDAEEQKPDLELSYSPQTPLAASSSSSFSSRLPCFYSCSSATSKPRNIPGLHWSTDAVEYGVTSYAITGEDPLFHIPPSPKLDAAWDELYNCMSFLFLPFHVVHATLSRRITKSPRVRHDCSPTNRTQFRETKIVELDVFHNLHCLNMIPQDLTLGLLFEAAHGAGSSGPLRDTSVVVWQWDPKQSITTFQGSVAHTCRNFEKLREWGKRHKIQTPYDNSVQIEDNIVIPIIPKDFTLR
ncbi:hypothetical protein MVEN_01289200 [Mycena venus]|uniref:Uncharacterized protein n=1 Tax=Mycena venus TaxID=2733690 RepID=A0A8H7CVV1_9AGAR|nr:hypothetical protein MVEN_01289200 [Mycena venus]